MAATRTKKGTLSSQKRLLTGTKKGTRRGAITSRHTGQGALLGVGLFEKLDGAGGGDEEGGTGALLIGELALGEHLDMAELGHGDVALGEDRLGVVEGDAGLAGDAIGDALLEFLACIGIHLGQAVVFEDGDADIEGRTCIVVVSDEAEFAGETEDEFTFHLVGGDVVEGAYHVGLGGGAYEEGEQGLLLGGKMVEHELQLCTIVGHIVGFATDEVGTTLTNAEDLVGNQLGLLCLAAGLEEIAGHHIGGLELQGSGLLGLRWCRNRRSRWFGLLVDGPEAAVVGEIEGGKGDLVAEIDVIGAGAVGLGGTTELYLGDFPVDLVFLSHVLEAEILLGIHGELSGHDLGAVGRDLDLDFGGGQAIGEAVVEVVTDGDLLDGLGEGACGEEGGEEGEGYFHWELGMMGSHGWLRRGHGGADGTNARDGRAAKNGC